MATNIQGTTDLLRKNLLKAEEAYSRSVMYPVYMELAGEVTSGKQQLYERAALVAGLGLPQIRAEYGAAPITSQSEVAVSNYQGSKRILRFVTSNETLVNDQYGMIQGYGTLLKGNFDIAKEYAAAAYLNGCQDSTVIATIQGEPLASTSHQLLNGTASNLYTLALSIGSIETLGSSLMKQKAYKGMLSTRRGPYQLECHTDLSYFAQRLVDSDNFPITPDNDINAVKRGSLAYGKVKRVVASPYFANSNWWALSSMNKTEVSRMLYERLPYEISSIRYVDTNDSWSVTAKETYIFIQLDWRGTVFSIVS